MPPFASLEVVEVGFAARDTSWEYHDLRAEEVKLA